MSGEAHTLPGPITLDLFPKLNPFKILILSSQANFSKNNFWLEIGSI